MTPRRKARHNAYFATLVAVERMDSDRRGMKRHRVTYRTAEGVEVTGTARGDAGLTRAVVGGTYDVIRDGNGAIIAVMPSESEDPK